MAELYCVPLGQTARHLFYKQIQAEPYQDSILILPNRYLRKQAQKEANVMSTGIDTLATRILNKNGYVDFKEITRNSQELITAYLIEYLAGHGKFVYFDKLVDKKGFIKAAASLIGQLSRSGATEEQIKDALINWGRDGFDGQKDQEVALLYALYRQYLKDENWFDLEGKYRLAIHVLADDYVNIPWKHIYISDFYSFDVLQLEFLKQLSRHCDLKIGLMYEENKENVFSAVKNTFGYLAGFCKLCRYNEEIKQPADLKFIAEHIFQEETGESAEHIKLYELKSRDEEMRWALTEVKKLLEKGVSTDKILITMRQLDNYNGFKQIADEYGVPVSLPAVTKLIVQPLTEFILLMLQAFPDNREGTEAYFKLLNSELGKLLFTAETEGVIALQHNAYYTSRKAVEEICTHLYQEDKVLKKVTEFINQLTASAKLNDYLELLQNFIDSLELDKLAGSLYKENKLDLKGLKSCLLSKKELQNCLESILEDYEACQMADKKVTLAELLEILNDAFSAIDITLAAGKEQGILVTEVVNVQGQLYDYVYLLGLREGEFPAVNNENWIYNDQERAELSAYGIDMPNTAQAYAEDMYFFAAAAAQCCKELYISWYKDDSAGASSYIDEVVKLFDNLDILTPKQKVCASEREVLALADSCEQNWLLDKIGNNVYAAALIDKERAENSLYNGVITGETVLNGIEKRLGNTFSASKLEIYAACPFRFLGEQLWQKENFDEKSETFEPADEGSLLHEVLAAFIGGHLREKLTKYPLPELKAELESIFAQKIAKYAERNNSTNNVLWQADTQRLKNILSKWLLFEYHEQSLWEDFVPCAVEKDFKNKTALSLTLHNGRKVQLAGRIDRMDTNGAKFFITDYKRSSAPAGSDLPKGLDLQLPVYLLAAEKMQGDDSIAGGGYLSLKNAERKASIAFMELDTPTVKCNNKLFADSEQPWADFKNFSKNLLCRYIESIYEGNFAVQPAKACSAYCPLKNICRIGLLQAKGGEGND